MVGEGKFVEHARFGRNCYGTSVGAVEAVEGRAEEGDERGGKGGRKTCVLDIEMEVCQFPLGIDAGVPDAMGSALVEVMLTEHDTGRQADP